MYTGLKLALIADCVINDSNVFVADNAIRVNIHAKDHDFNITGLIKMRHA